VTASQMERELDKLGGGPSVFRVGTSLSEGAAENPSAFFHNHVVHGWSVSDTHACVAAQLVVRSGFVLSWRRLVLCPAH
jgi:hypothetical protein